MKILHRLIAIIGVLCMLTACVGDPVGLYRNVRQGNYSAAIAQLDHAKLPNGPDRVVGVPAIFPANLGYRYPLEPLHGFWFGHFSCGGETRELKLFVFEPRPSPRSLAVSGQPGTNSRAVFEIRGSRTAGGIRITPQDRTLNYAPDYRRVSWEGNLQPDGSFEGIAVGPGCGNLHLDRVTAPDNPEFQEAENHQIAFHKKLMDDEFQTAATTGPKTLPEHIIAGWGVCMLYGGCPMPGISAPGLTRDEGGSSEPDQPKWQKIGPNDFRMVPQIESPQITPPAIHPNYE